MTSVKTWYRKYKSVFLQFILVTIATGVVFSILPSERQFRYEYRQGAPWFNEDLIAPFNFPIYKTDMEIKKERDSLNNNYPLFFIVDSIRIDNTIRVLHSQIKKSIRLIRQQNLATIPNNADSCIDNLLLSFQEYISQGVLDTAFSTQNGNRAVMVVSNNIATDYTAKELPAKRSGTIKFRSMAQKICGQQSWVETMTRLMPSVYTQVYTLEYDSVLTRMNIDQMQEDLSLTRGMIQEGQRIISRGEVISQGNYIVLESLRSEYKSRGRSDKVRIWLFVGKFFTSLIAAILLISFMVYFRKGLLQYNRKSIFVIFMSLISFVVAHFIAKSDTIDIYLIPFAIVPIIISVFFDARFAIFIFSAIIVIMGLILPNAYEFVFTQYIVGVVAVFSLTTMYKRSQIFLAAANIFLAYSMIYVSMTLMQEGDFTKIEWTRFAWFGGNSLLTLWSYPLIYLFEKMFRFLSNVTLMELSDTNSPLLRKLNERAPGTFQHSSQVANLAENVILQIGGNPLLVRTGALYHDIGKMNMPQYFIENQINNINPHDNLPYDKSAEIIISHVDKGVEMAKKHNLPKAVIDFIKTHHGDSVVQYFYRSYLNANPHEKPDKSKYQYKGPVPFTKETAVVMLADSVEAASRSLKVVTKESIELLVDTIIDSIVKNNQLRNSDITFRDIEVTKEIFKSKLFNIYHTRIEYPAETVQEETPRIS
ncbi:MAG: HDIG domain-containing protein [Salinivirgaceae bacterium]|nr:HDIG domain-containing protein [Salinivirgaceae bacterium]MDD4747427.1 HDIG domain-containing protein [Salinivirgaceae bacterium]MDY0280397.1 HDIG domain-containing protein [Salinivirgaceae bacterium]